MHLGRKEYFLLKLPTLGSKNVEMEKDFRDKQRKAYVIMRIIYDFSMAILILGMGFVVLFGEKLKIPQLTGVDPLFTYLFSGICLLYGGFRLYRGFKRDY
jgi:hypothetical protein